MVAHKKSVPARAVPDHTEYTMPSAVEILTEAAGLEASDATDAFVQLPELNSALAELQKETSELSSFLQPSEAISQRARNAAKALFAYTTMHALRSTSGLPATASASTATANSGVLPELHVVGFDAEQVWLQVELQTEAMLRRAQRQLKKLSPEEVSLVTPEVERDIDTLLQDAGEEGDEQPGSSDSEEDMEEEAEEELRAAGRKRKRASEEAAPGKRRGAQKLPVEDDFLELDDMERFVRGAEIAEERGSEEEDDEDEEEEGSPAAFSGSSNDDDDEDDGLDDMLTQPLCSAGSPAAFSGSGDDDDEDDGLDDVLARSAKLVGRSVKPGGGQGGKKKARGNLGLAGDGSDNLEGGEEATYEDFFGSRRSAGGEEGDMYGEGEDEDEEGFGAPRRKQQRRRGSEDDEGDEEGGEDEDEMEGGSEDDGDVREGEGRGRGRGVEADVEDEDEDEGGAPGATARERGAKATTQHTGKGAKAAETAGMSAHERRLLRLQENIRALEEVAMGEKEWQMRGEIDATRRPLNSALEIDLDFETTQKAVPQPTDESTADVEGMIRKRIADARFDDPVRIVAAGPERKKVALELDDSKSKKGLGELYEDQYVRTVTGVAEDKDDKVRVEARALFVELCAKLDALTHFHFAPKPVVQELEVRSDVAAVAMEEVAPLVVSAEAMRRPDEVYKPTADGKPTAEGEMSREDRKRRRAQKKRAGKLHEEAKGAKRKATPVTEGGEAQLAGRRSESGEKAAAKAAKKAAREGRRGGKSEFSKSASVFKKLQDERDQPGAGAKQKPEKAAGAKATSAAAFKL